MVKMWLDMSEGEYEDDDSTNIFSSTFSFRYLIFSTSSLSAFNTKSRQVRLEKGLW